ncbi:MAG: ATP synthase subunit I [Burkholderiaceae bacterium]
MFVAVGLQVAVVVVLVLVTGGVWGVNVALSVAFGGGAAIVPNGLFALRLAMNRGRTSESYPVVFFLGEIVKIGLTVALLVWAATSLPQLQWPPLLLGLVAALKAPFLLPLVARGRLAGSVYDGAAGQGQDSVATRPARPTTTENR